jgi:hypothetical protein
MKTKVKIFVTFGIILAFAIGFITGLSLEYPRPKKSDAIAGTIAKVKKYRNTKATESDIMLRDQLVQEGERREALVQLLSYYYMNSVSRSELIDQMVEATDQMPDLKTKMEFNLNELKSYSDFLNNTRNDILAAVLTLEKVDQFNPALVRNTFNQAVNIITQIRYRNIAVLDFIDNLDSYVKKSEASLPQQVSDAFNQLAINELKNAILTKDVQRASIIAKYNIDVESAAGSVANEVKSVIQRDVEQLKVGFFESEMLKAGFTDSEMLNIIIIFDAEKLGIVLDTESISAFLDSQSLDSFFSNLDDFGAFVTDSEALNGIVGLDKEVLSLW